MPNKLTQLIQPINQINFFTMGYRSFEELEVYKAAREFRKKIYKLVKELPAEEKYNLGGQMRRAAVSLTNNIAEGHGRYFFKKIFNFAEFLEDL